MSNNLQLPCDIKEQIAEYVPIDWAWVTYDNDPVWYMGLYVVDYHRLFKIRADREIACTCKLYRYITNRFDENGDEISTKECPARSHICQCSGSHDITNGYPNQVGHECFHYTRCRASKHIIDCHCTYGRQTTTACIKSVAAHNCLCVDKYHSKCEAFMHNCICQHRIFGSKWHRDLDKNICSSIKRCKAQAHLCICIMHPIIEHTDNREKLICDLTDNCKATRHYRQVVTINELTEIPKHAYLLYFNTNTFVW